MPGAAPAQGEGMEVTEMLGMKPFGWMVLVAVLLAIFPACGNGEDRESPPSGPAAGSPKDLSLSVGQRWKFVFYESGTQVGTNEMEVTGIEGEGGAATYTLTSALHLKQSTACKPTDASSTLTIDGRGAPIAYTSESSIGSG